MDVPHLCFDPGRKEAARGNTSECWLLDFDFQYGGFTLCNFSLATRTCSVDGFICDGLLFETDLILFLDVA